MQGFTFTIKKRERRRFRNTVIEKKKRFGENPWHGKSSKGLDSCDTGSNKNALFEFVGAISVYKFSLDMGLVIT